MEPVLWPARRRHTAPTRALFLSSIAFETSPDVTPCFYFWNLHLDRPPPLTVTRSPFTRSTPTSVPPLLTRRQSLEVSQGVTVFLVLFYTR